MNKQHQLSENLGNVMNTTIVFIQFKQVIRINIHDYIKSLDKRYKTMLLTTEGLRQQYPEVSSAFETILSYEKLDATVITSLLLPYAQNEIVFVSNDEYCLQLCDQLNNRYNDRAILADHFVDKVLMKKQLAQTKINFPNYIPLADYTQTDPNVLSDMLIETFGLPLVIKPRNESNNRGVHIIQDADDLPGLITELQPQFAAMEAEQYITGRLYHCNIVTYNNANVVVQIGEYLNNPVDLLNDKPIGSKTVDRDSEIFIKLANAGKEIVQHLQARNNSVTHIELFLTEDGKCIFLEIAHRAPGGLVAEMADAHCGMQLEKIHFDFQIHQALLSEQQAYRQAAWLWFPASYIQKSHTSINEMVSGIEGDYKLYSYKTPDNPANNHVQFGLLLYAMDSETLENDLAKIL